MPPTVRTDLVLRLHTDKDGLVWYGDDGQPATNTCLDAYDFFDNETYQDELDNARVIRLLGTRANSPLVVKLQERRISHPDFGKKSVMLGSPAAVPACWVKEDPSAVLHHIWQPSYGANLSGHWHEMTNDDYSTYAMIDTIGERRAREVPEVTKRIAAYHPAWPAVTFVSGHDEDAACQLLCDVIDPRWFRHPTHPQRLSRLHAHLGLTPENMASCAGGGPSGLHFNRATTALRVWYNRAARRGCGEPGDFLYKIVDAHPGDLAKGLLRGTQRLVEFVAAVWLDAVRTRHPEAPFDMGQFFRDSRVTRAFEQHRAACKRV